MVIKKIHIVFGTIVVITLVITAVFYVFAKSTSAMYSQGNVKSTTPYFITTEPIIAKNILLPIGTKISYKKNHFWEKNEQKSLLKEENITSISLKEGTTMLWGGVPITGIDRFFNPDMKGYTVSADFSKLHKDKETEFSNLWKSCNDELNITVANTGDWSFSKKNISDIESCGVNYQRYFKEKIRQQEFLDNFYHELLKIAN